MVSDEQAQSNKQMSNWGSSEPNRLGAIAQRSFEPLALNLRCIGFASALAWLGATLRGSELGPIAPTACSQPRTASR